MKSLLNVSGLIEIAAGIGLLVAPSTIARILLGVPLNDSASLLVGRLAGAALIALAFACITSHHPNVRFLVVRMMLCYNIMATAILLYAAVAAGLSGIGIWPAILTHASLLAWCFAVLINYKAPTNHSLIQNERVQ